MIQTGKIRGLDFRPEYTPEGIPVVTCFEVRGNVYVVDEDGTLFNLVTPGDDPLVWAWSVVQYL